MIAQMQIEVGLRDGISYLKNSYCDTPFKVANITEDKKDPLLKLMQMSVSPGLLNSDAFYTNIKLATATQLQLHTQSYQRLFTMQESADMKLAVALEPGSAFCYLPHPTVPHKRSNVKSENNIYLSDGCSLIFGEILSCGRKLNGEVFELSSFQSITHIYQNNQLVIKENVLLNPTLLPVGTMGQLGTFTHQAALIYLHPNADISGLIDLIRKNLSSNTALKVGVSATPINGLLLRVLAQQAEILFDTLKEVAGWLPFTPSQKTIPYVI